MSDNLLRELFARPFLGPDGVIGDYLLPQDVIENAFCPTGKGGGVKPTCSPGGKGGGGGGGAGGGAAATAGKVASAVSAPVRFVARQAAKGIAKGGKLYAKNMAILVDDAVARPFRNALDKQGRSEFKKVFKGIFSRMTLGTGPLAAKAVAAGVKHSPKVFRGAMAALRGVGKAAGWLRGAVANEETVANAFCATGPGGGVDPSCSPGGGGSTAVADNDVEDILGDMGFNYREVGEIMRVGRGTEMIQRLSRQPKEVEEWDIDRVKGADRDVEAEAGPVDSPADVSPIIVGYDGDLIDGHHRLAGLRVGGNTRVRVIVANPDDLKAAEEFGGLQGRGSASEENWVRWLGERSAFSTNAETVRGREFWVRWMLARADITLAANAGPDAKELARALADLEAALAPLKDDPEGQQAFLEAMKAALAEWPEEPGAGEGGDGDED